MSDRPKIVVLCGSTRFGEAFRAANLRETLAGKIVLSIGCDFKSDDALGLTDDDKARMDELHLRKIDLADEVLILNCEGYVGLSAAREIAYAILNEKPLRWWEGYNDGWEWPVGNESCRRIREALEKVGKGSSRERGSTGAEDDGGAAGGAAGTVHA